MTALAATGIVVTDTAGILMLRAQLIRRVDGQLDAQSRVFAHGVTAIDMLPTPRRGPLGVPPHSHLAVYRADGTPVMVEPRGPDLGDVSQLRAHADQGAFTVDGWRVQVTRLTVPGPDGPEPGFGVSAVSLLDVRDTRNRLVLIDLAVSALVLAVLGLAAASVARIGLRPLTRMERLATEISGGDLSRRVENADPHTESGRLGRALNGMLGQIEAAVAASAASQTRLRQFLADASHELRTPLTSIQGFTELYRRGGAPPGPELDEAMARIESEAARMRLLVGDLLLLARLDEERPLAHRPVDLLAIAADAVRDAHVRVPTRFVLLDGYGVFEPVTVLGDEARLRQVATNLVANALQHTPDQARIEVRVGRLTGPAGRADQQPVVVVGDPLPAGTPTAVLEVTDSGPGLTHEDARRVFERLYRADQSRARSHGGAGLGLSIVAAIVTAHAGRIELWTAPGEGARFRVLLPARPDPPDGDRPDRDHLGGARGSTGADGDPAGPGHRRVGNDPDPEFRGTSEPA